MKITSKGQVTIPLEIREQFGLLPNTEVDFKVDKSGVWILPAKDPDKRRGRSIIEHMRGRADNDMSTDEIMALTRRN